MTILKDKNLIKNTRQPIGDFIRQLREEKNITQLELGEAVGLTAKTIDKIECNAFPYSIDILIGISIYLNFTIYFEEH